MESKAASTAPEATGVAVNGTSHVDGSVEFWTEVLSFCPDIKADAEQLSRVANLFVAEKYKEKHISTVTVSKVREMLNLTAGECEDVAEACRRFIESKKPPEPVKAVVAKAAVAKAAVAKVAAKPAAKAATKIDSKRAASGSAYGAVKRPFATKRIEPYSVQRALLSAPVHLRLAMQQQQQQQQQQQLAGHPSAYPGPMPGMPGGPPRLPVPQVPQRIAPPAMRGAAPSQPVSFAPPPSMLHMSQPGRVPLGGLPPPPPHAMFRPPLQQMQQHMQMGRLGFGR